MAAVINTNISSLNAQRNLTMSQSSLATSLQRLSSGLRINSAKDDAAGLAISQRMTSQINGLTRAAANANDGISLAQTAEGALGQVGDSLQRIRELAVQSANATNSSSDRAALQQEVSQLVSEISRIGDTTSFNGLKILDGTYTNQQYQIGANAGETINVSIGDSRASQLGATTLTSQSATTGSGAALLPAAYAGAAGALVINGKTIDVTATTDANSVINAINLQSGATGVTAARATTNTLIGAYTAPVGAGSVTINGTSVAVGAAATAADFVTAVNNASVQTGVSATTDGTNVTFSSANGADFSILGSAAGPVAGVTTASQTFKAGITLSTKLGGTIDASGALATSLKLPALAGFAAGKVDLQVSTMDISTIAGANKALAAVDAALTQVSGTRATLGAIQNRFTAVVANLSTTSENLTASRSRIQDADFAAETANMTRGQILQQAGTAMLAQANSLPNGVLALLRG
ncbi:MAG TPA: flagellin [Oxalicibacterium sp.]|uniref:flagellin N-terminal helical domain-containing protein n=1 Tax=Oxalicibacterium sp. TaxID=2766525 RepID=UPI002C425A6B|nr:flagellin [Oxalicibacterium sp.]HWU98473.1 flagellin [Oxalicibacterium sp.]